MRQKAPVVYLPHGGGPLPLLRDPSHAELVRFLESLPSRLGQPQAIIMISAHWEEPVATVCRDENPQMLFDYYGFPPESYEYNYPAPGHRGLADKLQALLSDAGIPCSGVDGRGFDHGMFVPMMLMYPDAMIPCVQLSLVKGLDPLSHLQLGEALQTLREENVLIIGSGMSFHNLRAISSGNHKQLTTASDEFHYWLTDSVCGEGTPEARKSALQGWEQAPWARFAHPREEHLLPLHVSLGAAGHEKAELLFNSPLMGHKVAGFGWF